MAEQDKLPPLPPSDKASLGRNAYSSFYEIGARDFWDQSEVTYTEVREFGKCDHFFEQRDGEAVCKKCHAGFIGYFEVRDGKLFHQGDPMGI